MPPAMTDYTYALGDTGFVLNSDNSGALPFIDITSIAGLDSAPIRTNTTEHEGTDGTYIDASFQSMRTIVLQGTIYDNTSSPDILCDQLRAAYSSPAIRPFYFKHPSQSLRFVNCQGGGAQYPVDTSRRLGQTNVQLTLLASDPYIYDYPGNFATAPFAATSGIGIGFNMGFNTGFGGTITLPTCNVANSGTHTAYPVIQLNGPLVNPVLRDSISSTIMQFNISLTASDWLVIDCRNKTVTLDNQVTRRSSLVGINWLSVPAQTADSIFLTADSGSGSFSVLLYNTYY